MGKLKAAARHKLPKSTFGLPGQRKYPMPDKSHAVNAKGRATQELEEGNITSGEKAQIDAKANAKLNKQVGGPVAPITGAAVRPPLGRPARAARVAPGRIV